MLHAFWSLTEALEQAMPRVLPRAPPHAPPHAPPLTHARLPHARARLLSPLGRARTHALWPAALLALLLLAAAAALPALRARRCRRQRRRVAPLPLTAHHR